MKFGVYEDNTLISRSTSSLPNLIKHARPGRGSSGWGENWYTPGIAIRPRNFDATRVSVGPGPKHSLVGLVYASRLREIWRGNLDW